MMNWWQKYRILKAHRQNQLPDFVSTYIDSCQKIDKKMSMEKTTFVVFDTETTGLDHKKDKIISIAGVKVKNNQILVGESFDKYIKRENIGSKETTPIHQILHQDLAKAEDEQNVLKDWLQFTEGCVLVAHHAQFDVNIVGSHLERNFYIPVFNSYVDTFGLARRADKDQQHYHLDALTERYKITVQNRHSAIGDALATAELFLHLVAELKRRGNYRLKDFLS